MGYSYYFVAESPELKEKILEVLNRVVPDASAFHPVLGGETKNYWVDSKCLGYVASKDKALAVGMEVVGTNDRSHFFLEILKWAATKAGKRIAGNKIDPANSSDKVPYLVYDGDEIWDATPIPSIVAHWRKAIERAPTLKRYYATKRLLFRTNGISISKLEEVTKDAIAQLERNWK